MEKIIKQKKGKNKLLMAVFGLMGVFFVMCGVYSYNKEEIEKNWKDVDSVGEYGYIEAQFLFGPYVEETLDSGVKKEYYLAMNKGQVAGCLLIKQNSATEIPVVSSDEEYKNAINNEKKRMIGYSRSFNKEVLDIFITHVNEGLETNEVNSSNISEYIGEYYLDTTATSDNKTIGIILIVLGTILIISVIISLMRGSKNYRKMKKEISDLKKDGRYDLYETDINSSNSYKEKKYLTVVTNEYIYNFEKSVLVIPIKNIINTYKSCMIGEKISKFDYICIETNDNQIYSIAFKPRGSKDDKFENLLNQIKQRMVK